MRCFDAPAISAHDTHLFEPCHTEIDLTLKLFSCCYCLLLLLLPVLKQVNEALLRVFHMLDEPASLLQPAVLGRVLMYKLTAPFNGLRHTHSTMDTFRTSPEKLESASLAQLLGLEEGANSSRGESSTAAAAAFAAAGGTEKGQAVVTAGRGAV